MNLSRKDFLKRGIFGLAEMLCSQESLPEPDAASSHVRPPGFQGGREAGCYGCDECSRACPAGIIAGIDGVEGPVLDFSRGSCTFCRLCVGNCPHGVLESPKEGKRPALGIARCDARLCLASFQGCFSCVERCPQEAITARPGEAIAIDPHRCTGCGVCEYVCPLEGKAVRVAPL